ncbi:RNA-binding S4 domain-containing protein [Nesterenkonia sp. MY13]|uniref:RNA-binding S4 domain-containing protein n=1 Tax=Nesterenkonia sedimenti TaxID=1463632 RepID=A0A7X8TJA8_9MICC|nr:RNA-binding S4 domain-containing protein [Nesterenkonia sedimenti]NLS09525.1 RNA-binding S4 domain-containing protein [Nesterenkonia sedimenti]
METFEVPIRDESIRLGQLLKLVGAVENGVVAREVIAEGLVTLDGKVETRRGAQVRPGQRVVFDGEEVGLPSATLEVTSES